MLVYQRVFDPASYPLYLHGFYRKLPCEKIAKRCRATILVGYATAPGCSSMDWFTGNHGFYHQILIYPLVVERSYGKCPIYRGFMRIYLLKMVISHSYVK